MIHYSMTIALLCPTRGRPEQCKRMIQSARRTSSRRIPIYLMGDTKYDGIPHSLGDIEWTHPYPTGDYLPTAHKWNLLAEEALSDKSIKLFMLAADDMVFTTPGWDKALLDHYNALENKIHVYHLQDSRDKDGTPHPIMTREYIEAMGYFVPPIFLHWFIDSWTVEIAKANNCFTYMRDYELQHIKPSDQGKPDETHSRIRNMGWRERDGWVNNKMQHVLEAEKARLAKHFNRHWFPSVRDGDIVAQTMDM